MAKVHIGGAGGAPSNNVIRSLREAGGDYLTGQSSEAADLLLADVEERYVVPPADDSAYGPALLELLERLRPDLLHVQNDFEVRAVSRLRDEITELGVRLYLPSPPAVEACVNKFSSYAAWRANDLPVPETRLLRTPDDLAAAMSEFGPSVWLRAVEGGGGAGAVPTDSAQFATAWIDRNDGWGRFTAAAILGPTSVTWQSLWRQGELVVAQTRLRRSWAFSSRAPSGVTGVTRVAETVSDESVDRTSEAAIRAIDPVPHGLYGVDLTYDEDGTANLTEINVGRFFTTIHFFTEAGLNMPAMYRDLALDRQPEQQSSRINPLPDGLVWIRGMDVEPVLTTVEALSELSGEPLSKQP
jgi:hypothetical protein